MFESQPVNLAAPAARANGYCDYVAMWMAPVNQDALRALRKHFSPRLFVLQDVNVLIIGARIEPPVHPAVAIEMAYGLQDMIIQAGFEGAKFSTTAPRHVPPEIKLTKMDRYRIGLSRAGPRDLPYFGNCSWPVTIPRRDGPIMVVDRIKSENGNGDAA